MSYAGLDLSRKRLDVHVLREDGKTALIAAVSPDTDALRTLARRVALEEQEVRATIESMNGARFVHDILEFAGWDGTRRAPPGDVAAHDRAAVGWVVAYTTWGCSPSDFERLIAIRCIGSATFLSPRVPSASEGDDEPIVTVREPGECNLGAALQSAHSEPIVIHTTTLPAVSGRVVAWDLRG
jgi:hypothetical protein